MHELISEWSNYSLSPPFILPKDLRILNSPDIIELHSGWESYISQSNFDSVTSSKLHTGLIPMPYIGNLEKSSIFILMLNPGLSATDYFGEYRIPEYRKALVNNLKQRPESSFIFLNPEFSWHSGYQYWNKKLSKLITEFAKNKLCTYDESRNFFMEQISMIELLPYHSSHFKMKHKIISKIPSALLAKKFIHDSILPKARNGNCIIVATRGMRYWDLPKHKNIITYERSESRGAHLSPTTRGGSSILKFLSSKNL
jgi:hypothetical protein